MVNQEKVLRYIFPKEMKNRDEKCCPFCGEQIDINMFKNKLSMDEYNISGLCQKCQDKFFICK